MPPAPCGGPPRLRRLPAEEPISAMRTWRLAAGRVRGISPGPRGPLILLRPGQRDPEPRWPRTRAAHVERPTPPRCSRGESPRLQPCSPAAAAGSPQGAGTPLEPRWKSPPTVPGGEAGTRLPLSRVLRARWSPCRPTTQLRSPSRRPGASPGSLTDPEHLRGGLREDAAEDTEERATGVSGPETRLAEDRAAPHLLSGSVHTLHTQPARAGSRLMLRGRSASAPCALPADRPRARAWGRVERSGLRGSGSALAHRPTAPRPDRGSRLSAPRAGSQAESCSRSAGPSSPLFLRPVLSGGGWSASDRGGGEERGAGDWVDAGRLPACR